MKTTIAISTAALLALSAPAFAGKHAQGLESSGAAKTMVQSIKDNGAEIAPNVSGESARGDSGWGNGGSAAFGPQVSKRGGDK